MDLLTTEEFFQVQLDFNPKYGLEPYSEHFQNVGYDTGSFLINLGDFALIQCLPIIYGLFILIFRCLRSKFICARKNEKKY